MPNKKSALTVSLATLASRVFGLARDVIFGAMFGAGQFLDAYLAAFQIPNLLRDMFAEGALSQAFTSTFTKLWEKEGEVSAWELAQIVFSTLLFVLGILCLLGILLSHWIVLTLNPGFLEEPGKIILTTTLTQLLWPFILFVSLAAMVMGILNSRHFFGLPASASIVFNLTAIVFGVALAYWLDPQEDPWHPHFQDKGIYGVACGVLLGGISQLAIQLPLLFRLGFRFRWRLAFQDPRLITVIQLMIPTVLAAMAVQINVLVNNGFVSFIDGGRTWYTYAFRLFQFPVGIFGVAIATVTLPAVARHHASNNLSSFGHVVENALRFALYLTLPASVGLALLAPQIITLVFQYGAFSPEDARQTALALQAFALGVGGYSCIKVLIPCFIALNQPRTPFRVSMVAIVINLILASFFFLGLGLGHIGLALTVALVIWINFFQLLYFMRQQIALGHRHDWLLFLLQSFLSNLVLASFAWAGGCLAETTSTRFLYACTTLGTVLVAATAYFIVSWALGLKESIELFTFVKKKSFS